jgi:hypothetical protein
MNYIFIIRDTKTNPPSRFNHTITFSVFTMKFNHIDHLTPLEKDRSHIMEVISSNN